MRTSIFLKAIFLVVFLSGILTSCVKDSSGLGVDSNNSLVKPAVISIPNNNRPPVPLGAVAGTLSPVPDKASVVAFNDNYISSETIADQYGYFILDNLPAGGYSLSISYILPGATDYTTITIPKIIVSSNSINDLGVISL